MRSRYLMNNGMSISATYLRKETILDQRQIKCHQRRVCYLYKDGISLRNMATPDNADQTDKDRLPPHFCF